MVGTREAQTNAVGRILSLDAFRGCIMFSMLAGTLGLKDLAHLPVVGIVYSQLTHAPWRGFHFEDLILPAFLFIIGVAMAFSSHNRRTRGEDARIRFSHAMKRFVTLFFLGFVLSWIQAGKPYYGAGVLQVLAFSYIGAYVFIDRPVPVRWIAFGSLLFIYWFFIFITPVPEAGRNSYVLYKNLVFFIDDIVTSSATRWGYLYTIITSIAVVVYGGIVGSLLVERKSDSAFMRRLALYGIAGIAAGLALHPGIPIIKRMFTPSYTLLTCGLSTLLFLGFYWLIDVRRVSRWSFFFVVLGANSIFVYMVNGLLSGWLTGTGGIFAASFAWLIGPWMVPMSQVFRLAAEWLLCLWLFRKKIFFKI